MAKIKCPDCDKIAKVKLRRKSYKAQCPRCKRVLRIPPKQEGVDDEDQILAPLSPLDRGQAPLVPMATPVRMQRPPSAPTVPAIPVQPQYQQEVPPSLAQPELFPPLQNQFSQGAPPPMPMASPIPIASVAKGAGRLAAAKPIAKKKRRKSKVADPKSLNGLQVGVISLVVVMLIGLLVGGSFMMFKDMFKAEPIVAFEQGLNAIPIPTPLPDLPRGGGGLYDITLAQGQYPGWGMQLRVFMPRGTHKASSLLVSSLLLLGRIC